MFRREMFGLASLLLLSGSIQAQDTPRAIIERAVKAMGGEEKLALKSAVVMQLKGTVNIKELGQAGGITLTGEISTQPGGYHRFESKMNVIGMEIEMLQVINGKEGWRLMNGTWAKLSDEEFNSQKTTQYPEEVSSLLPLLRDKEFKLELLPETEILKKKAVGIKVTRQAKPDVQLFFEKESGLPCQYSFKQRNPGASKEETQEVSILEYMEPDWIGQTEETLKKANLPTEPAALLAFLRKRTPSEEQIKQVRALIRKLADDSFEVREQAGKDLVNLGPAALPALQNASKDDDAEVASRAQDCLKQIQEQHNPATLRAVVRLLGLRRAEGAVEALLAFLPGAERTVADEIRVALLNIAQSPGGPPPALVKALEDKDPARRDLARAVLGKDDGAWLKQPGRLLFPTGLKMPRKLIYRQGDQFSTKVDMEILQIQLFNRLDDKLFTRPANEAPARGKN